MNHTILGLTAMALVVVILAAFAHESDIVNQCSDRGYAKTFLHGKINCEVASNE